MITEMNDNKLKITESVKSVGCMLDFHLSRLKLVAIASNVDFFPF